MTDRYAIYFAPPADSPLARFGAAWLGRDAETGAYLARPAMEGFSDERLAYITAAPRGYGFLALVLADANAPMQALEDDIIRTFHRFRAPPTPAEYIRREAGTHTPRQEELLRQWGYPFVLDEFRFHMTLTCELDQDERHALRQVLETLTAPLCARPLAVDGIALFEQEAKGVPFRLTRHYPLGT